MSHVGPIMFGNETARGQLVEHGEVTTFRKSDRTTGDTWWNRGYGERKQGDVTVEKVASIPEDGVSELEPYEDLSGFGTAEDWAKAIREVHGSVDGTIPEGYVYRVTRRDD